MASLLSRNVEVDVHNTENKRLKMGKKETKKANARQKTARLRRGAAKAPPKALPAAKAWSVLLATCVILPRASMCAGYFDWGGALGATRTTANHSVALLKYQDDWHAAD